MKPLFEIKILLDKVENVKGKTAVVTSIPFHGTVESPLFHGEILPGAVDTQIKERGKPTKLSARYMLAGTDFRGESCRIYVDNTAWEDSNGVTEPRIVTDSEALQWLEQVQLEGKLTEHKNGIVIEIYEKVAPFHEKEYIITEGNKSIYGTMISQKPQMLII